MTKVNIFVCFIGYIGRMKITQMIIKKESINNHILGISLYYLSQKGFCFKDYIAFILFLIQKLKKWVSGHGFEFVSF